MSARSEKWSVPLVALAIMAQGCGDDSDGRRGEFSWDAILPPGVPAPRVPEDNPLTWEKIELGRHLFYDQRLSANETQACASCHVQERGFAEDRALSVGSTGDIVPRNSPGLQNVAYNSTLTWLNPNFLDLESQIPTPLFGEFPVELGVTGSEQEVLDRLRADEIYQDLFHEAFPDAGDPFEFEYVIKGLASFVRSMVSFESPFDHDALWDDASMSPSAKRGWVLTQTERFDCFHCHSGFQFAIGVAHENTQFFERGYFNNGIYNIGGTGDYPPDAQGLYEFTGNEADRGKFRAQSFRNIMLTAPYMHDGSVATIDEVLDIYARGGRLIDEGPYAGDGRNNPNKSEFVHGFENFTEEEREDLKAFFESLTDSEFIADPRFSNPW